MEIVMRKVSELTPYEKNAKTHDKRQIDNVAQSIKELGWLQPLVVDKDGVVVVGHCRLLAAKKLKQKEVPCLIADDLTDEQIKKYRVLDNKLNESPWDLELLAEDIEGLDFDGYDLDFGFDEDIAGAAPDEVVEDDFDVNVPQEPKAKMGDIYQLGNHRLMCGDSTDKATVEMLMDGKKADMVFTDPPYGIDVVQGNKIGGDKPFGSSGGKDIVKTNKYMGIKGDETTDTAKLNFEIIKELSENQIIFGGNYFTDFLPPKSCWCIWDKENTGNFADVEMAWTSFNKGAKLYRWLWNGLCRRGERAVEGKSRVHPTQKPVGLIAEILKDFTKEDDIILDCFGGSGSTLIACEQIDRTCYMIEYEAHYVDVIIKRWETLTGKNAVLLNG